MKVKRVALVHSSGEFAILHGDFPYSARDIDILNTLYEVGKNVWIGKELYRITEDFNGCRCYFRYEIFTVKIRKEIRK